MQGFTHTDNSLVTVYEKLKTINNLYQENLADMNAQQLNQANTLHSLGMVLESPQKETSVGPPDMMNAPVAPSLIVAISQEIDKLEMSYKASRGQVENARFIGEALFRQQAQPMSEGATAVAAKERH